MWFSNELANEKNRVHFCTVPFHVWILYATSELFEYALLSHSGELIHLKASLCRHALSRNLKNYIVSHTKSNHFVSKNATPNFCYLRTCIFTLYNTHFSTALAHCCGKWWRSAIHLWAHIERNSSTIVQCTQKSRSLIRNNWVCCIDSFNRIIEFARWSSLCWENAMQCNVSQLKYILLDMSEKKNVML